MSKDLASLEGVLNIVISGFNDLVAMRYLILILGLLGLIGSSPAFAINTLRLGDLKDNNVSRQFEFFRDSKGSMRLDEVKTADFSPITQAHPNFGFTQDVLWFRATIDSDLVGERILLIDYALLDHIELFLWKDGKILQTSRLGDADERTDNASVGTFALPAKIGNYEIYIRINTGSSLHATFLIMDAHAYARHKAWTMAVLFGILSILGAMTFFHVFVLVQTGSRSYLYYVLFVFSIFLFELLKSGVAQDVLWSQDLNNYFLPKVGLLNSVFGALFTQRFLGLRSHYQRFPRIVRALGLLGLGLFLLSHVLAYSVSVRVTGVFGIITAVVLFSYGGTLVYRERNLMARYYLTAWALFLAGVIVYVTTQFALLPLNLFTQNAMVFGAVIEVLLLSLALGARYQMTQAQNLQLEEHRLALQMELRQELQSRITLVSELAHRMNNPLNYVRTASEAGRALWGDLAQDTKALLESSLQENDPEGDALYHSFVSRFEEMGQWFTMIDKGTEKSTRSIAEIRNLSGVDGYSLEHISLSAVWKDVWERIEADLGEQQLRSIKIQKQVSAEAFLLGNRFSLVVVFDNLLKEWARQWPDGYSVSFTWQEKEGLPRLEIKVEGTGINKSVELLRTETLQHLTFILKPYATSIRVSEEGSVVLENLTFIPLKQEQRASGTSIAAARAS